VEDPFVMHSFVRLTLLLAAAMLGLILALFVLKLFVVAGLAAAAVVGVLFALNFLRAAGARRGRTALP
jgi:hypothetical protein